MNSPVWARATGRKPFANQNGSLKCRVDMTLCIATDVVHEWQVRSLTALLCNHSTCTDNRSKTIGNYNYLITTFITSSTLTSTKTTNCNALFSYQVNHTPSEGNNTLSSSLGNNLSVSQYGIFLFHNMY